MLSFAVIVFFKLQWINYGHFLNLLEYSSVNYVHSGKHSYGMGKFPTVRLNRIMKGNTLLNSFATIIMNVDVRATSNHY